MTERKKIGIFGIKLGDNSFGMTLPYIKFLEHFGHVTILTPSSDIDLSLDMVVIPGGPDISPVRYDANYIDYGVNKVDPIREFFDVKILPQYINNKIPVFGICRGFQAILVYSGLSLNQHMYHETNTLKEERGDLKHLLNIPISIRNDMFSYFKENNEYDFLLNNIKNNLIKVNSLHHQSFTDAYNDNFKYNFEVIAAYNGKEDPAVEAIEHKYLPIAAVQYHPEELFVSGNIDPVSIYLINKLLNFKK